MSRVCSVCGKGKMSGNKVSHSNRRTPKTYSANVQKVHVRAADGRITRAYVCCKCLKANKVERTF